jgi:hypothetical protein
MQPPRSTELEAGSCRCARRACRHRQRQRRPQPPGVEPPGRCASVRLGGALQRPGARTRRHDHDALIDYAAGGEDAALSVPTPEHYLPLLYVAALQADDEPMSFPVDGIDKGSLGMLSAVAGGG